MKKNLILASAGLMLFAGACSSDMPTPQTGDGNVTISLQLPATMGTRAFGDGLQATSLSYAIYDADTKTLVASGDDAATFSNLKATLQVSLVNGRTYDFVFWADNGSSSPYTFDAADAEDDIKVDMTFSEAGNEGLDAFYGSVTKKIEGPTTVSATLTRPFAQINLGTDDLNSKAVQTAYGTNFTASVQTSSYMSMNPMTGAVIGELQTVNFDAIAAPSGEAFPVSGYDYLSMIYILADPAQDVVDVNYTIYNDGAEMMTLPVSNVPVQRNYRTNIYGSVLTSPANLQIDINPDFETPDYERALVITPEEFASAITDPNITKLDIPSDLDLSELTPEELTISTPKTLNITPGTTVTTNSTNPINITSDLIVNGGEFVNESQNLGQGVPANTFIVRDGGSLNMNGVSVTGNMAQKYHGSAASGLNTAVITYYENTEVNMTNCRIVGSEYAICGMGMNNTTPINLTNCYLESTSSSTDNGTNWAYATRLRGTVTIKDCTVVGIQGALSIDGGATATIDGGTYYTQNSPGKTDAFYALYATGGATVTINNGYFYGPNKRVNYITGTSCVVGGDNDTNKPLPNLIINGGFYSGQPYNHVTAKIYEPATGHTMESIDQTIDGRKYIWQVK
ncbi:MAG: hypothetical protein K2M87_07360 [Muribaculaceae bacterium]|nr:hypothetical protein [Muribaculaceae bacterium]